VWRPKQEFWADFNPLTGLTGLTGRGLTGSCWIGHDARFTFGRLGSPGIDGVRCRHRWPPPIGKHGPPSRGLLTRACLRFVRGDTDGCRADLDEAWEIAEPGPMRLHMADIQLYRARSSAIRPLLPKRAS